MQPVHIDNDRDGLIVGLSRSTGSVTVVAQAHHGSILIGLTEAKARLLARALTEAADELSAATAAAREAA